MKPIQRLAVTGLVMISVLGGVVVGRWVGPAETVSGSAPVASSRSAGSSALEGLAYLSGYKEPESEGGLLLHDEERSKKGVFLVVAGDRPGAVLIDHDGHKLHEWSVTIEQLGEEASETDRERNRFGWWRRARVLPGGDLLGIFDYRALFLIDRDSNVRWRRLEQFHHDLDFLPDGRLVAIDRVRIDEEGPRDEGRWADRVVFLDIEGNVTHAIRIDDAIAASPWAPLARRRVDKDDPFHTNTLQVLDGSHVAIHPAFAAGNLLLSFRNLDTIAVLDPDSERIVWVLTGLWTAQHEPSFTPEGRIVLFDNKGLPERSRVLEVDPLSQEITWSWTGGDLESFQSHILGMVQQLGDGILLVTESTAGRAFQVSREGDIIWRYDNPFRARGRKKLVGSFSQVERLSDELASEWLAKE